MDETDGVSSGPDTTPDVADAGSECDGSGVTVERRQPEAVFALLGDELRVAILRALGEEPNEPKSFSELRQQVGERDSGKFNYHLRKLDGVFVEQTDEGYELSIAGRQLVGSLVAGTYTAEATMDPLAVEDPCPHCRESPIVVEFADDYVQLHCSQCEEWSSQYTFPAGTLDQYDQTDLPAAFDRWMSTLFDRIHAGFCVNCAGRLAGTLATDHDPPLVHWHCERCGDEARTPASMPVLVHPLTQGFLYEHGVDPSAVPSWQLTALHRVESNPDEDSVTVTLELDGDSLTATVDGDGNVTDISRSDR